MEISILKVVISALGLPANVAGGFFVMAVIAAAFLLSGIYGFIIQFIKLLKTPFSLAEQSLMQVTVRARNVPTGPKAPKDILKAYGSPVRFGKERLINPKRVKHEINSL